MNGSRHVSDSVPPIEINPAPCATVVLNTAPSNARTWQDFAALINGTWCKGALAFIQIGVYLHEAKAELERPQFERLVQLKLAFDASVARKLMGIADNRTLCAHGHKLP